MNKKHLNKWNWSTSTRITLYCFIFLFLSSEILVDIYNIVYPNKLKRIDLITAVLALSGFIILLFFQYNAKWIVGTIFIGILVILSIIKLYLLVNIKYKYN